MLAIALVLVCFAPVLETWKTPFTLEETYRDRSNHFEPKWFTSKFYPNNATVIEYPILEYFDWKTQNVLAYDPSINETFILLTSKEWLGYDRFWYLFSSDRKHVLLRRDKLTDPVQPWLMLHKYDVYSPNTGKYTRMGNNYFQHAEWIPGRAEIVYVKSNNVYIAQVLPKMTFKQITTDGKPGIILNGIPDLPNQDETFSRRSMLVVSPSGNDIVYISLNYTDVPVVLLPVYGDPEDPNQQYPRSQHLRYSKPGNTIPTYRIWHLNRLTNEHRILAATAVGKEIPANMHWLTKRIIQIMFLNRAQDVSTVELCSIDADKYPCRKVYEDKNKKGWANDRLLRFSKDGMRYIERTRQTFHGSEFYHLQIVYRNQTKSSLTTGNFSVSHIVDWDEDRHLVFFQSYKPNRPSTSHTFVVHESIHEKPYCMTCLIISPEGVPCKSGHLSFSRNFQFFAATCSGPTPEVTYVYENFAPIEEPMEIIDNNAEIRKMLHDRLEPKVINLRVPVTNKLQAEVRLMLPPDMDFSGEVKYPLIIYVDGRPEFHLVDDKFYIDWSLYLTTNRTVIYGIIDGRGSGRKSTDMMYSVYKALGTVEIEDQIFVTKYLHSKLRFIDKKRTGIWGWNYGGYVATKVLENDVNGVFKCGAAVSPITDWIFYNSAYSEKYMGFPWENVEGYRESSALYHIENLRNKKYLLIHGTGDTDVHFQNAMTLAKVLQDNNIFFEQVIYSNEDHFTSSFLHVFYTLDHFFERCFNLPT